MLSRSCGTPVVSVGERRDFSHSLTVIPLWTAQPCVRGLVGKIGRALA